MAADLSLVIKGTSRPPDPSKHRRSPGRGRRRLGGDRGAVLVEAAFILPILVLVSFGIIEFGMAYGNASTTTSATRSGARLASTTYAVASDKTQAAKDVGTTTATDLSALSRGEPQELWLYKSDAAGQPIGGGNFVSCGTSCWKFTWNTVTKKWNNPTGGWSDPDACGSTIDSVGVYLKVRHDFTTGFFGSTLIIKQHTVMRLEPLTLQQCGTG